MAEMRWNPLLETWTMVASNRQNRPHMPTNDCPFCPGSGKVPERFDVFKYDNDFPVLSQDPDVPDVSETRGPYRKAEAYGKCEVVLYSPEHDTTLSELPVEHIEKLVALWRDRHRALSADQGIKCIFPFENKGQEVGVTMPHPHGQIYGYGFIPLKIRIELDAAKRYHAERGRCLLCDMNEEEIRADARVIERNAHFIAYVPHFTDYPYGVFIQSLDHMPDIGRITSEKARSLASILRNTTGAFDSLYDKPFPYMMVMHQVPLHSPEYADAETYYHFHIEFYTPLRSRNRIKFYASSEMGAWAATNVAPVEEMAVQLRSSRMKFIDKSDAASYRNEMEKEFARFYGDKPGAIHHYQSPARVNLIGEHVDYNGGLVMPVTVDMKTHAALRFTDDGTIRMRTLQYADGGFELPVEGLKTYARRKGWQDYAIGVLAAAERKFPGRIDRGFELLVASGIPDGSGLSSSAALEAAVASAANDLFGLGLDGTGLAVLCREAENDYAGVSCGIMDQFAVINGSDSHALVLDCATLESRRIPFDLKGHSLIVMNTNKPRRLEESKYNQRLGECERALELLRSHKKLDSLCAFSPDDLDAAKAWLTDSVLYKRFRHCVTEQDRVKKAAEALSTGDIGEFGRLLTESHESLKIDYEVTGVELDCLVGASVEQDGCVGARMTGAGFGGCALAIVRNDAIKGFIRAVSETYAKRTGLECTMYACVPSRGAGKE